MFCTNCGKKISDDSKFCVYCGHNVEDENLPRTEDNNIKKSDENFQKIFLISIGIVILLGFYIYFDTPIECNFGIGSAKMSYNPLICRAHAEITLFGMKREFNRFMTPFEYIEIKKSFEKDFNDIEEAKESFFRNLTGND